MLEVSNIYSFAESLGEVALGLVVGLLSGIRRKSVAS